MASQITTPVSSFYAEMQELSTRTRILLRTMPSTDFVKTMTSYIQNNWESLFKAAAIGVAAYGIEKFINNRRIDAWRAPVKDLLEDQDLDWIQRMRTNYFFRIHQFYITQFPDTPSDEYMKASKTMYWLLKYLGAKETRDWNNESRAHYQLQKLISRDQLLSIDVLDYPSLEELYHHPVIINAFHVPSDKRIDSDIWSTEFNPIRLALRMDPNQWTAGELYKYLDNQDYVVHLYDMGRNKRTWMEQYVGTYGFIAGSCVKVLTGPRLFCIAPFPEFYPIIRPKGYHIDSDFHISYEHLEFGLEHMLLKDRHVLIYGKVGPYTRGDVSHSMGLTDEICVIGAGNEVFNDAVQEILRKNASTIKIETNRLSDNTVTGNALRRLRDLRLMVNAIKTWLEGYQAINPKKNMKLEYELFYNTDEEEVDGDE